MALDCDVFIVDLDANVDQALGLIENICSRDAAATVMATSRSSDAGLADPFHAGRRPRVPAGTAPGHHRHRGGGPSPGPPREKPAASPGGESSDVRGGQRRFRRDHGRHQLRHRVDQGRCRQGGDRRYGLAAGRGRPGAGPHAAVLDPGCAQERGAPGRRSSDDLLARHTSGLAVLASPEQYTSFNRALRAACTGCSASCGTNSRLWWWMRGRPRATPKRRCSTWRTPSTW